MKTSLLASALLACACSSAPPPKVATVAPPPPSTTAHAMRSGDYADAVIRRAPRANLMTEIKAAFEASGHSCIIDSDGDVACDKADNSTPTMYFHYAEQPPEVGVMFTTMAMNLATAGATCESAAPAIAEAKANAALLQQVCKDGSLVLAVGIPIPERGLSVREFNRSARLIQYIVMMTSLRIRRDAHPMQRSGDGS